MRHVALLALIATFLGSPAFAHIIMEAPNGGEVVAAGSQLEIRWRILISHGTQQNWDILYSDKSADGPWIPIEMDVPTGDPEVGSIHYYDWTVPELQDDTVWVRVIMDNSDTDYEDINDKPFTVTCPGDATGDFQVTVDDLLAVLAAWGPCNACDADFDRNGFVDVDDLLVALGAWGGC